MGTYLDWAEREGIKELADTTTTHIRKFQKYFFDNAPFYKNAKIARRKGNKRSGWNRYHENIHALYGWALKRDMIDSNPATDPEFRLKAKKQLPPVPIQEDLKKVLDYIDTTDQRREVPMATFFYVLAYTGLRLSELLRLRWSEVSLKSAKPRPASITVIDSKNDESRIVPISSKLLPLLKKLPHKGPLVFDNGNGGGLYYKSHYYDILRASQIAVGVTPFRLHDLRHFFGKTLAENGVSLGQIAKLMGHRNISTTMMYQRFATQDFVPAIETISI